MTLTIARDDGQTDGLFPWHCETDTMQQQRLQLSSESFHQLYGRVYAFAMMHRGASRPKNRNLYRKFNVLGKVHLIF